MSTSVNISENPSVEVTEAVVRPRPPDSVGFLAEGMIRPNPGLLAEFEGLSLKPVGVTVSVGPSRTVEVDLSGTASLRLESVDVGVETPEVGDAVDAVGSVGSGDATASDAPAGRIAFTVEGSIDGLSAETLEDLGDGSPTIESITFSVAETVETDGGSPLDPLLEVTLFGYGVIVRRNGIIEVRAGPVGRELGLG